jgi:hypothetical protein
LPVSRLNPGGTPFEASLTAESVSGFELSCFLANPVVIVIFPLPPDAKILDSTPTAARRQRQWTVREEPETESRAGDGPAACPQGRQMPCHGLAECPRRGHWTRSSTGFMSFYGEQKMQLTDHFYLEELIASGVAQHQGIDNTLSIEVQSNLVQLAKVLEEVRTLLGNQPVHVSSGYRSPPLNCYIGARTSRAWRPISSARGLAIRLRSAGYWPGLRSRLTS